MLLLEVRSCLLSSLGRVLKDVLLSLFCLLISMLICDSCFLRSSRRGSKLGRSGLAVVFCLDAGCL
jgi:hypothetical protein|uniref:Uncharacterized protein n=1 Tax=Zea mays TaxID=4577 RepID=B6SR08_MAIZE|nr:hypothetical protein [Zea mays]